MNLFQSFKMAFRSIIGNKLRSFLTMLGIIIGVASVIVLVSIGQGSTQSVTNSISSLGTNLITVSMNGNVSLKDGDLPTFKKLSGVKNISPYVSGNVTLKNGSTNSSTSAMGVTSNYISVRALDLSEGRFISDIDNDTRNKVVVLGSETAETLFGFINPVGQTVKFNGDSYEVIGVLKSKGTSGGMNADDTVLIPFSTAQRVFQNMSIQSLYIEGKNADTVTDTVENIKSELAYMFPNDSSYYSVSSQQDLMETFSSVSSTMTTMLGGIAGISLIVGGIGIMNIMLVSVSERTKEIGIRKAIGARRGSILLQFLIEAVVLSALGGLIGVLFGIITSQMLVKFASLTISLSTPIMLISFGFSIAVGVIFGVFPANKASKLNPIEALRFE